MLGRLEFGMLIDSLPWGGGWGWGMKKLMIKPTVCICSNVASTSGRVGQCHCLDHESKDMGFSTVTVTGSFIYIQTQ